MLDIPHDVNGLYLLKFSIAATCECFEYGSKTYVNKGIDRILEPVRAYYNAQHPNALAVE